MIWFIAEIRQDGSRIYHDPGEESRENAETIRDYLQRCNRSKTFIITNVRDY